LNQIVQLTTQDISSAIPVTTSLAVAEQYQVDHKSIMDLVKRHEEDFEELGKLTRFEIAPVLSQRSASAYNLNEEQFYLLVTFMKNTPIARRAKIEFVKMFALMKRELMARAETRHIGKAMRFSLTDSIRDHMADGTNAKKFAYSNYTKLVYKRILGMDVKAAKQTRRVPEGGNIRDFLTIAELERVQALESKIAAFIEISDTEGKDDKAVYAMVKAYVDTIDTIAK
jgi:phage regulator Rha-like protein